MNKALCVLLLTIVVGCGKETAPPPREPSIRRISTSISATADVPELEHRITFEMPEGWSVGGPLSHPTVIDENGRSFEAFGVSVNQPFEGPETVSTTVRLPEGSTAKLVRITKYEVDLDTRRIRVVQPAGGTTSR